MGNCPTIPSPRLLYSAARVVAVHHAKPVTVLSVDCSGTIVSVPAIEGNGKMHSLNFPVFCLTFSFAICFALVIYALA